MHDTRFVPRALLLALVAFILAACSSTSAPVGTITGIDVNVSDTLMLTPGDQVPLELSYAGTGAIPSDVTITSSNLDVVTIQEDGVLLALTPGEATITIASTSNPDVALTLTIFVTDPLPSDEGFGMTGEPGEVGAIVNGETVQATSSFEGATFTLDAGAFTTSLTAYTPDGDAVPILTSDGLVKPATGGTMILTGAGFEANTPIGVYLGEATLLGTTITTRAGAYRITVTIPADTLEGDQALTIVGQTLDASGAETAFRGRGRSSGRVITRVMNWLFPRITGMELTPATVELNIGDQRRLNLALQSAGYIDTSVTWTTSNAAVASVSSNGTVEAISAGTATITATSNADASKSASATITVRQDAPSYALSTITLDDNELIPGGFTTLTVQLVQPDGSERDTSGGPLTFAETPLGAFLDVVDHEDGSYTATFMAGTKTGVVTILAIIDGVPLADLQTVDVVIPTVTCENESVGDEITVRGITYTKRALDDDNGTPGLRTLVANGDGPTGWDLLPTTCTSGVTDMSALFQFKSTFNEDISSWDVSSVADMEYMFRSASAFNSDISDWDTGSVTTMERMFYGAVAFNGDLGNWDVSNVTDMDSMFYEAAAFNVDLNNWDVSNVTDMDWMFREAKAFNGDVSAWDVSNVTSMNSMFREAEAFNGDVGAWDVSNVTDMTYLFDRVWEFGADLSAWDVGNVTGMAGMFRNAQVFDSDLSSWNVANVESMASMFFNAYAFNMDIGNWDVGNVTNMTDMFYNARSFNQNLSGWCVSEIGSSPDSFDSGTTMWTLGNSRPVWGTCP